MHKVVLFEYFRASMIMDDFEEMEQMIQDESDVAALKS